MELIDQDYVVVVVVAFVIIFDVIVLISNAIFEPSQFRGRMKKDGSKNENRGCLQNLERDGVIIPRFTPW